MRIVSLQPSVSVILDRLGRLDALVACTRYCLDAVPALHARQLPLVQDSWTTSTDELSTLRPDLVIASVPYQQESLAAILKAGYPVLALAPHSLADIENDIRLIASILRANENGERVIQIMQRELAAMRARTADSSNRPLVYCEEWGKPLIHSQCWIKELVEIAGGTFLGQPGATTTAEAIAEANPDVMVLSWCGAGDRVPLERIVEQRGWQKLKAVTRRRVYCIRDEWLNTPAPTLIEGLHALALAIRPENYGKAGTSGIRCIDFQTEPSKL